MAKVTISNVVVKDNPCPFNHPFQFEITFECIENLNDDLEWKIIYVGCAESEDYDQTLDTVVVGPVIAGRHMFVFETDPPNATKIPKEDILGVTVVLLTCHYRGQEFIRVGYYVNNDYAEPELKENPPTEIDYDKLQRNILATSPRVTRFKIDWGDGGVENSENVAPVGTSASVAFSGDKLLAARDDTTMDAPPKQDAAAATMTATGGNVLEQLAVVNGISDFHASNSEEAMQM